MKYVFGLTLCIFSFFFISDISNAQTTSTIAVSPAVFDVATRPGDRTDLILTVRNGNDVSLPISIAIQSLVSNDIDDFYINPAYDAKQWLELEDDTYILDSKEVKQIPVTITVPEDASPGGHYAQISVRGLSLEADPSLRGESLVIPEVNASVFITVDGDIKESFRIQSQNLGPFQATRQSLVTSVFSIENNGNVHNLISPKIIILKDKTIVSEYVLPPRIVLPDLTAQFTHEWVIPEEYGSYEIQVEFLYGNSQETVKSKKETMYITPPLNQLVGLALVTWMTIYGYTHRKNFKKAWHELVK